MLSLLIIASQLTKIEIFVNELIKKEHIDTFDVTRITSETSIGIEIIREVQKKAFFKPLKSQKKIIIIEQAHTTTIEAQNALLKLLEEPPQDTIIILAAANIHAFLPTIISRCTVITLEEEKILITQEEKTGIYDEFMKIITGSISTKLYAAQDKSKDKTQTLLWIRNLMYVLREYLLKNPENITFVSYIEQLQNSYQTIASTNINPRMTLEHVFLSLTHN